MRISLQIFILTVAVEAFAQTRVDDTTWFDVSGKETVKNNAEFYRFYKKANEGYFVTTKYLNGRDQMLAYASSIDPELIKDGNAVYFDKNGVKEKQGNYVKNRKDGTWIYYFDNGRDSSLTLHKTDGSQEMIRRSAKDNAIFTIVETNAEFPGGLAAMMKFISNTTEYPEKARRLGIGGKTFLKFVIDENGQVDNISVTKSSGLQELDEEAVRVVNLMPTWKPATMTGRTVKCYFNLPFSYTLTEPFHFFNSENKNENYILAWQAILSNNSDKALELYYQDSEDLEAWYNIGVIHFHKKDKKQAKKYFEKVKDASNNGYYQYYVLVNKFLTNNF